MPLTREQLEQLINNAKESCDWSMVESADVSKIKYMSDLFSKCKGIEYLDLSSWDVSNVEDMSCMFEWSDFNNDSISQWDVSNVENMMYMFCNSKYNQPLNNWDVSNVENMMYMFNVSHYNHPLNDWNVSNVKDMESIFKGSSFSHDISSWDTSNVLNDNDNDNEDYGKEHIEQCQEFFAKIERTMDTGIVDNDTDLDGIYKFLKTNESESVIQILEQRIMDKALEHNSSSDKTFPSAFKL